MILSDYVEDVIIWKNAPSKWQVLKEVSTSLFRKGIISDSEEFAKALTDREKVVSTGIGIGVAVPHARLVSLDHFILVLGIVQDRGVDWDAIDGKPVQLIFVIGAPANAQTEYLNLLSKITTCVKDPAKRKKMIKVNSKEDLISLLNSKSS